MAYFIMTGEIKGGEILRNKSKTAIFPGHSFTCDFASQKFS